MDGTKMIVVKLVMVCVLCVAFALLLTMFIETFIL